MHSPAIHCLRAGWVVVEPSAKQDVLVRLTSGWMKLYHPAACVSPRGGGTTTTTTTTTTTVIVNGVPTGLQQQLAGRRLLGGDAGGGGGAGGGAGGATRGTAIGADGSVRSDAPIPPGLAEALAAWESRELAASLDAAPDGALHAGADAGDGAEAGGAAGGRQLLAVKRKPRKPKKKLANSVAECSLRLQIRKPDFDLQVTQPWDTKLCKLRGW